jgi:hypothetical protein
MKLAPNTPNAMHITLFINKGRGRHGSVHGSLALLGVPQLKLPTGQNPDMHFQYFII